MATAIGARRLGEDEQRRRGFLGFLAEASELLASTLDTSHAFALLVQLCVPRLAATAMVELSDGQGLRRLAALADVDEARAAELRTSLTAKEATQAPLGTAELSVPLRLGDARWALCAWVA